MSKEELPVKLVDAYRQFDKEVGDHLLGPYMDDGTGKKKQMSLEENRRIDKICNRYRELRRQMYELIDEM
jgi:hypothetical protein